MSLPTAPSDAWLATLRLVMCRYPDVANAPSEVADVLAGGWHAMIRARAAGVALIRPLAPAELGWLTEAVGRWVARSAGARTAEASADAGAAVLAGLDAATRPIPDDPGARDAPTEVVPDWGEATDGARTWLAELRAVIADARATPARLAAVAQAWRALTLTDRLSAAERLTPSERQWLARAADEALRGTALWERARLARQQPGAHP